MEGKPEITTVPLGGMLGHIAKMKKSGKWGFIKDDNGNVATFMKYKAHYFKAWDYCKESKEIPTEVVARYTIGSCF